MKSEAPVSRAAPSTLRRVAFTLIALLVFWVLTHGTYLETRSFPAKPAQLWPWVLSFLILDLELPYLWWILGVGVISGSAPGVFLALSVCNAPRRLIKEWWVIAATAMFMGSISWAAETGQSFPSSFPWGRLYGPTVLVSGFVLIGARRSALADIDYGRG